MDGKCEKEQFGEFLGFWFREEGKVEFVSGGAGGLQATEAVRSWRRKDYVSLLSSAVGASAAELRAGRRL